MKREEQSTFSHTSSSSSFFQKETLPIGKIDEMRTVANLFGPEGTSPTNTEPKEAAKHSKSSSHGRCDCLPWYEERENNQSSSTPHYIIPAGVGF